MSLISTTIEISERPGKVTIDFDYDAYSKPSMFDQGNSEGIDIRSVKTEEGEVFPDWLHNLIADDLGNAVWNYIYDNK